MAQTKSGTSASTNTRTAQEMQQWHINNPKATNMFADNPDLLKLLRDVNKSQNVTVQSFDKDAVINYLQNVGTNEERLRNLSQYLFWRSHIYNRIIDFYSSMFELDCRTVIPSLSLFNPAKKNSNGQKMIKKYYETVNMLDAMQLSRHFPDPLTTCFREDVYYGIYWLDDDWMTVIPWPASYARIDGVYKYGNFSFSIDMSWFRSRQDILEFWGEPFTSMYDEFLKTNIKWQHVTEDHALCLKYNSQDYNLVVPPFIGLFLSLISLEDLGDLTAIQNEQEIYKLLIYKLKGLSGAKESNKFEVDPTSGSIYFKQFLDEAVPKYTSAAMLPGSEDLQVISFSDDATTDTNKITKATESILNTAGGAEVLNGATINSAAAFTAAMIANMNYALSSLLPQIEGWVEMVLQNHLNDPCKVKFHKVTSYTKEKFKEELLTAAQNGMPTVFTYMATLGNFSERDTLAMNALQESLGMPDILKPIKTAYTQSGKDEGGRPETPDDELSPSGQRSRDE